MSKIFAGVYFRKFSDFYHNSLTFKPSIFYIVCTFRWCIDLFPLTLFTLDETSTRWSFLITVRTQPPFTLSNSTKEIFSKSVKSEWKQKEAEANSLLCITAKEVFARLKQENKHNTSKGKQSGYEKLPTLQSQQYLSKLPCRKHSDFILNTCWFLHHNRTKLRKDQFQVQHFHWAT